MWRPPPFIEAVGKPAGRSSAATAVHHTVPAGRPIGGPRDQCAVVVAATGSARAGIGAAGAAGGVDPLDAAPASDFISGLLTKMDTRRFLASRGSFGTRS